MENVTKCTKELAEAVRDSRAYRDFERVKEMIRENPEIRVGLDEFRKKSFQLQNSRENLDWYDEVGRFQKEHEGFRKNPLVQEYLDKELEVCRMLQRIVNSVVGTVQLEIEAFADEIEM